MKKANIHDTSGSKQVEATIWSSYIVTPHAGAPCMSYKNIELTKVIGHLTELSLISSSDGRTVMHANSIGPAVCISARLIETGS